MLDFIKVSYPLLGQFLPQRASNAENVSIWWRHHVHISIYWNGRIWNLTCHPESFKMKITSQFLHACHGEYMPVYRENVVVVVANWTLPKQRQFWFTVKCSSKDLSCNYSLEVLVPKGDVYIWLVFQGSVILLILSANPLDYPRPINSEIKQKL